MDSGNSAYRFTQCLILAMLLPGLLLAAGCGKKAAPFLSGPQEKIALEIGKAVVRGGTLSLTVRIPKEHFNLGREEEPWAMVRILRRNIEGAESLEERGALSAGAGFQFGQWVTVEDKGLENGAAYLYIVEARKRASRDLAASQAVNVRVMAPPVASGLKSLGREGAVTLSWVAPVGAGQKLSYDLFRRRGGEKEYIILNREPLHGSAYTDIEVTAGQKLCYRLRALIRDGLVVTEGPWTEEVCTVVE